MVERIDTEQQIINRLTQSYKLQTLNRVDQLCSERNVFDYWHRIRIECKNKNKPYKENTRKTNGKNGKHTHA